MKLVHCVINDELYDILQGYRVEYDVTIKEVVEYCIVHSLEDFADMIEKEKDKMEYMVDQYKSF